VSTLYVKAQDAAGVFLPAVDVMANSDGTFTLQLATSPTLVAGAYSGDLTLNLCQDSASACATPLAVRSVTVPFSVTVLDTSSTWPGNHLTTLSSSGGLPDWSTFQGNAAHTGYVPVTVSPDSVTTRWTIPVDPLYVDLTFNEPLRQDLVSTGGLIYTASSQYLTSGVLQAWKESDGTQVWQYSLPGLTYPVANPPAVAGGIVYMAAGHQTATVMFAFNAADGSVVYQSPMSSQWEEYLAPTIGPNGTAYANAGTYGGLYAFKTDGTQLFFAPQAQTSLWTPAVDAQGVYTYTGTLQVLDPTTGAVLKAIGDPTFTNYDYEIGGSPVLGTAGSVIVANYSNSGLNGGGIGNTLLDFRTDTGTIAWQVTGDYPTTPAYARGVIYAVNRVPSQLEARSETDGSLLWSWVPPFAGDGQFVSEVLVSNNLVIVSTERTTYAIDLTTHHPVFSYPLSGKLAVSASDILYIHGANSLVALNLR
jgi:hypothetical protein